MTDEKPSYEELEEAILLQREIRGQNEKALSIMEDRVEVLQRTIRGLEANVKLLTEQNEMLRELACYDAIKREDEPEPPTQSFIR